VDYGLEASDETTLGAGSGCGDHQMLGMELGRVCTFLVFPPDLDSGHAAGDRSRWGPVFSIFFASKIRRLKLW
jgi:hypothetical protein